jgi:lambda repressor-like predicted transcriptional regulator
MLTDGINPDGSLSPEAIRALLKFKGLTISPIARATGFTDAQYHQVINREYRNETIEDSIAEALGLKSSSARIWGRGSATAA